MAKIATLVGLLLLTANMPARAEPNFAVWRIAHERLLAKWRCSEPRCGWTVGGYTCSSPKRARFTDAQVR
jgi:hypothetical protein